MKIFCHIICYYLYANIEDKGIQQGHIVASALHDGLLLAEGNTVPQATQEGSIWFPSLHVVVYSRPAGHTTTCQALAQCTAAAA